MRVLPKEPPPGPSDPTFWQSPVRGPWMTAALGSLLLPFVVLVGFTGFMSHAAYNPNLGMNQVVPRDGDLDLLLFDWPTGPSWLYALNQGLHTVVGIMVVPLIFAKLWSVFPKLFAWPPIASPAQALERISLLLLVGGAGFMWATGLTNSQYFYPWHFNFVVAHYYGAWVFLGALFVHVATKFTTIRHAYAERGVLKPLMDDVAHTEPEPHVPGGLAPEVPEAPTISRRGVLGLVGASSASLFLATAGQSVGGPLRSIAILAPRGRSTFPDGDFPINKTASLAAITPEMVGPGYRLRVGDRELTLEELRGDDPEHAEAPDRLRRGVVRAPHLDRRAAPRPRRPGRRRRRPGPAGHLLAAPGRVPPDHPVPRPGHGRRRAPGPAGRGEGPLHGPRLPRPHHRPRAARGAQHEVGHRAEGRAHVISLWKRAYGESPLHLLGQLVAFAIAIYAFKQIIDVTSTDNLNLAIWFVAGALLHDILFVPIYLVLDLLMRLGVQDHAMRDLRVINHVRVPVAISGVLLLTTFSLILGKNRGTFARTAGVQQPDFLARWALITAGVFLLSALVYVARMRVAAGRRAGAPAAVGT